MKFQPFLFVHISFLSLLDFANRFSDSLTFVWQSYVSMENEKLGKQKWKRRHDLANGQSKRLLWLKGLKKRGMMVERRGQKNVTRGKLVREMWLNPNGGWSRFCQGWQLFFPPVRSTWFWSLGCKWPIGWGEHTAVCVRTETSPREEGNSFG